MHGPEIVKAGETVNLEFSVNSAPEFDGASLMVWLSGPGAFDIQSGCDLPRGQKTCHWEIRIPADLPAGTVYVNRIALYTGSRQIALTFNKVGFQILARSGLVFPTSVEVSIKPSQVQLLRGEIARLQTQVQTLKASVAGEQEPLGAAKLRIIGEKIEDELNSLKVTESKFRELGDKSQVDAAQVFFDDLRTSYTEVLADLSGKANGRATRAGFVATAWPPQEKHKSHYSLTALAAFRPFELNELAYRLVADTETLTFNLEVSSNPEGATILYGRRGDTSYKQHSSPTNSTIKSLPYAIWIVRFQKQGFRDKDVEFNPFVEPNRVVHVDLEK